MNVWTGFSYRELLRVADLRQAAQLVFAEMATTNFESVLEALWHAEVVLTGLGRSTSHVRDLYEHVRHSLIEAVRETHVPWDRLPDQSKRTFAAALAEYQHVFTLNYDLLPYWALMSNDDAKIADFFWNTQGVFAAGNADLFTGWTGLYYLHGGVHLWQDATTGRTGKWISQAGGGLLHRLDQYFDARPSRRPLFVSEGTSRQKRSTIRQSDYLTFAFDQLRRDRDNVVILGTRLGSQDQHVVDALLKDRRGRVAVGIRPGTSRSVVQAKARYIDRLAHRAVEFFDSESHPLGDPALTVPGP